MPLHLGSYVTWSAPGGQACGRVDLLVTSGHVPGIAAHITGTRDNPAARVVVWRRAGAGWEPTDVLVGHKLSALTPCPPLRRPQAKAGPDALASLLTDAEADAASLGQPARVPASAAVLRAYKRGTRSWPGQAKTTLDAQSWGLARAHAFLALAAGTPIPGYRRDLDLLPDGHEHKHLPARHDQSNHGNRYSGGSRRVRVRTGTTRRPAPPPAAGTPSSPGPPPPSAALLTAADLDALGLDTLTDDDLEGLVGRLDPADPGTYDRVAAEMDRRDDAARSLTDTQPALADIPASSRPGAEHAAQDQALTFGESGTLLADTAGILGFNAGKEKRSKPSKLARARDAYDDYANVQYLRALTDTAGNLTNAAARRDGINEAAFFGDLSRAQVRRYASEELLRWFAEPGNKRTTFSDFTADYYGWDSLRRPKRDTSPLSQYGG